MPPCRNALAVVVALAATACATRPADDRGLGAPGGEPGVIAAPGNLPDLAGPLRLDALLPLVLERSPAVRAARARLEAAAERYPQAVALPDPMVEATYFTKNAMDPAGTFARFNVMLRQDFPLPAVLALRGEGATRAAEAEALRYEAAVRDVIADLKDVEAERAYLAGAARAAEAVRDVYRRYAEIARGGAASGATRLPESFRAEALVAQADYDLTLVGEVRRVEDQRLRALLALPAATPLGEPAGAPAIPRLDLDPAALAARACAWNQELRAAGIDVEIAGVGARMARWEYAPMFSIGVEQMVNDSYDMATGEKTDSTAVTVGLTLPIWYAARAAGVREADAKVRAARAAREGASERLTADVARVAFRARNAARLAELYGRELVPQAEKALLHSQSMIAEGKESLSSSLELAATWQQLRVAELRATADAQQAVAALERLLGTSLDAAPDGEHR